VISPNCSVRTFVQIGQSWLNSAWGITNLALQDLLNVRCYAVTGDCAELPHCWPESGTPQQMSWASVALYERVDGLGSTGLPVISKLLAGTVLIPERLS
jgi:hypothetical protein